MSPSGWRSCWFPRAFCRRSYTSAGRSGRGGRCRNGDSSWLSREGLLALLTFPPAGLFWLGWIVWEPGGAVAALGVVAAALAVATVYCTAMIYGSLKPVHQWHRGNVAAGYLALAGATGALWLDALARLTAGAGAATPVLAIATPLVAWAVKERYWRFVRVSAAPSTPGTATGLAGRVTLFEAPHTEANYLMQEMGFRVARKHAERLRMTARVAGFALPALLALLAAVVGGWPAAALALAAALLGDPGDPGRALAVLRRSEAHRDAVLRRAGGLTYAATRFHPSDPQ